MDKKTKTLIVVGLVAVGGYLWWKSRQDESTGGTSSAIGGVRKPCFCYGTNHGLMSARKCRRKCAKAYDVEIKL